MKETVVAAITAAITTYMQQEEQARAIAPVTIPPHPQMSNWRIYGLQELMRARTRWQVRKPVR
ncbi:MAG: hypothetical protein FJZ83_05155 [Chloroflexi bacterium]|nr:hypothetical protein [Chloroflexota bacterium]MBM3183407.1 hypothetical protein [Chloroflexota bacterium]MBM4450943.1 hypothetical protein [Chloroflexota bacterium]MBM4453786.1 hypothetical protein [Chloroflexota bacterium]